MPDNKNTDPQKDTDKPNDLVSEEVSEETLLKNLAALSKPKEPDNKPADVHEIDVGKISFDDFVTHFSDDLKKNMVSNQDLKSIFSKLFDFANSQSGLLQKSVNSSLTRDALVTRILGELSDRLSSIEKSIGSVMNQPVAKSNITAKDALPRRDLNKSLSSDDKSDQKSIINGLNSLIAKVDDVNSARGQELVDAVITLESGGNISKSLINRALKACD